MNARVVLGNVECLAGFEVGFPTLVVVSKLCAVAVGEAVLSIPTRVVVEETFRRAVVSYH